MLTVAHGKLMFNLQNTRFEKLNTTRSGKGMGKDVIVVEGKNVEV